MRVKCLAQEHHTMFPTRARTRTPQSGDERISHEATAHSRVHVHELEENICIKLTVVHRLNASVALTMNQ